MSGRSIGSIKRRVDALGEHRLAIIVIAVVLVLLLIPVVRRALGTQRVFITRGLLSRTLQLAVPFVTAGIGGLYAEKSGVVNIGLEGFLIISALTSVIAVEFFGGTAAPTFAVWLGLFVGISASTVLSVVFAVACIKYRANQIIAGLAIWFIALGFAPFISRVLYGKVNTPTVSTLPRFTVPVLTDIPLFGAAFTNTYVTTYLMFLLIPVSWYVLNRTKFGMWVIASGEHPEALDTAGVDVHRIRYSTVLISGALSGIGGVSLTLANVGQFLGVGQTMVNGRGFIALVTYLMGNYNPIATAVSGMLFAALEAVQIEIQQLGYSIPTEFLGILPHVSVIVVLVFFGYTRPPSRVMESYDSQDES
jgi:simple sugar transport system permease protein